MEEGILSAPANACAISATMDRYRSEQTTSETAKLEKELISIKVYLDETIFELLFLPWLTRGFIMMNESGGVYLEAIPHTALAL